MDKWLENLRKGRILSETELFTLCERVKSILVEENNVQRISSPVIICGDISGQFYDLLEIFDVSGELPGNQYIFLGNYVNRGIHSIETLEYLLILKAMFPGRITLLRGNHESEIICLHQMFYLECTRKYRNTIAWRYFVSVFNYFNIAAVIDDKIMCIHGGLSPEIVTLDQICVINRFTEIPPSEPFTDLLWSDPDDIEGWGVSPRGAGYLFGQKPTEEFCHLNDLILVVRGHQFSMQGYQYWFRFSNVLTLFSSPNFRLRCGNPGAICEVSDNLDVNLRIFPDSKERMN